MRAGPDDVLATGGSTGAVAELARTLPPGARHHLGEPTVHGILLGYAGPSRSDLDLALPVVTAALAQAPR